MGAHPQHRRTGSGVEGPDLPDAALLHDLLDPPPMAGVLELVADDGLHAARAERHQLEPVPIREKAKRVALSAGPAADEHGPVPTLHPGILQRRRAPEDGLRGEADAEAGLDPRADLAGERGDVGRTRSLAADD